MLSIIAGVITLAAVALTLLRRDNEMLPGPKGWPVIGSILPSHRIYVELTRLSRTHGALFFMRVLHKRLMVINTARIANQLLQHQSSSYAARPIPKMIELAGMDRGIVYQPNLDRLKESRKLLHAFMGPQAISDVRPMITDLVNSFLMRLSDSPGQYVRHVQHLAAGLLVKLSHGYTIQEFDDSFLALSRQTVDNFARASSIGAWRVNWLPWLSHLPSFLPGMKFKRQALLWRKQYTDLAIQGHQMVKNTLGQMDDDSAISASISHRALCIAKTDGDIDDDLIMFSATQVYTGGAETSESALLSFFQALAHFPDIQNKAQEEISEVTHNSRTPTINDRPYLPYLNAILLEILRCYPPIPSYGRSTTRDVDFNGNTIGTGTTVLVNLWGILRDTEEYPNAHLFLPERWMNASLVDQVDSKSVVFGFGRRVCPGRYVAEELLFSTMAAVLANFTVSGDARPGREAASPEMFTEGGIVAPKDFRCDFRLRAESPLHRSMTLKTQKQLFS